MKQRSGNAGPAYDNAVIGENAIEIECDSFDICQLLNLLCTIGRHLYPVIHRLRCVAAERSTDPLVWHIPTEIKPVLAAATNA